jgi:FkbM family methyltransferase
MSTKYFLLTKDAGGPIYNIENDQIIFPNKSRSYLLPSINMSHYNKNGLFESSLMEWCRQFCSVDGIFLDIGAHTGTYSISLADCCKTIYAFEPQKMTYYALCGSVALSDLPNINCIQTALGSPDQVGKATLNIRSHDGGGSSVCELNPSEIICQEEIIIRTMDSFFKEVVLTNPICFIKMDVEYNELNVLRGAVETLRHNNYPNILLEANTDSSMNKELFDFLENVLTYNVINVEGYANMFLATKKV